MFEVLGTSTNVLFTYLTISLSCPRPHFHGNVHQRCVGAGQRCVPTEGCEACLKGSDSGFHTCAEGRFICCCYDVSYHEVIDLFN